MTQSSLTIFELKEKLLISILANDYNSAVRYNGSNLRPSHYVLQITLRGHRGVSEITEKTERTEISCTCIYLYLQELLLLLSSQYWLLVQLSNKNSKSISLYIYKTLNKPKKISYNRGCQIASHNALHGNSQANKCSK